MESSEAVIIVWIAVALVECCDGIQSEADRKTFLLDEIAQKAGNVMVSIARFRRTDWHYASEGEFRDYRFFHDATVNFGPQWSRFGWV